MRGEGAPPTSDTVPVTAKNMYALGVNADADAPIGKPVICPRQLDSYQLGNPFDARMYQAGSAETLD